MRVPRRFHPHPYAASVQTAIEALGFHHVGEFPLAAFPGRGVNKRDLLKTRVIITAYNQHARLLPSEPLVGDTTKVYSVRGSRRLHEISLNFSPYGPRGSGNPRRYAHRKPHERLH